MTFATTALPRLALLVFLGLGQVGMAQATTKAATPKKSKAVKVRHQQNNSQESQAERDRRLYRECKGLPNAGACLGYTRR